MATKSQNLATFEEYYRDDFNRLVRFLIHQGASLVEAEDMAQDAMRAALQAWSSIDTPRAWVRLVAKRNFLRLRAESRRQRNLALRHDSRDDVTEIFDTDTQPVLRALQTLTGEQREVMAWRFDGYSPTEIAEMTGRKPATVRSHLRHARQNLARVLNAELTETARKEASDGP